MDARSEHFTERQVSALLRPLRSSATWENDGPHSGSLDFADTEEDGGSTPPAPTIPILSRAFVDQRVPTDGRDRRRGGVQRPESTSLLNQRSSLGRPRELPITEVRQFRRRDWGRAGRMAA
jgi:hypothetical protein